MQKESFSTKFPRIFQLRGKRFIFNCVLFNYFHSYPIPTPERGLGEEREKKGMRLSGREGRRWKWKGGGGGEKEEEISGRQKKL